MPAYARLDVYFPDGQIKSFLLDKETVSVGRAPSNTIVLDTDTISRHHFSITKHGDHVTITDLDSENGTWIDGAALKSNEPQLLNDVEEIQTGYLRLVYHRLDENSTQPTEPSADETQPLHRSGDFIVSADYQHVKVWPASSTSLEIHVQNLLSISRRFRLAVSGLPSEWLRVNRPEFEVLPNEGTSILLNIKPLRRPDVKPRVYTMLVEVQPHDKPEETVRVEVAVDVRGYSGFGIALSQRYVEPDERLMVYLHNHGSEELTIALKGQATAKLGVSFSMPRVTLAAGTRSQVAVNVMPRHRPLFGKPQVHPFTVIANAQNASRFVAALEGKAQVVPLLPNWALISFSGIMVSLLIALLLTLAGVFTPPKPQITNLRTNDTVYQQGDTVEVLWQAENSERVNVLVNQVLRAELDGRSTSYALNTDNLEGTVSIVLQAKNRGMVSEANTDIMVYPPMRVRTLRAEPDVLFAHVITPLTLIWQVDNAVTTRIEGLEAFTKEPIPAEFLGSGAETFLGLADAPLTFTLLAKDRAGKELSEMLFVNVLPATCDIADTLVVYDGPSERYPINALLSAPQVLTLIARDANSGWLKMITDGAQGWVNQEGLSCHEGFALSDLRQEVTIPNLLTATPTPLPTRIPTRTPRPTSSPTPTSTP